MWTPKPGDVVVVVPAIGRETRTANGGQGANLGTRWVVKSYVPITDWLLCHQKYDGNPKDLWNLDLCDVALEALVDQDALPWHGMPLGG